VTLKGLPLSYNRDMQEDKEPVIDAVETAHACLEVLTGVIGTLRVNEAVTAQAASDPMLIATDLADHLVQRGVPFREAHGIVSGVVAHALAERVVLSSLSRATLLSFHPALDVDPAQFFSVERSLEARQATGAPSRARVLEAIAVARAELASERP
jgi:argininosuccinate lyase